MSTIQIKRSLTAGNIPVSLADGELAINEVDEVLFYKNSSGVIRQIGLPISPDAIASTAIQINGGMEIDQQHNGSAVALTNGSGSYIVDQWQFAYNHTANTAVFSGQQVATNAAATLGNNLGFGLRAISSTALVTPNVGDFATYVHPIEGYRWECLNYGLASAHYITIGFWVYATVTGTGSVSIRNWATTRSYVTNFIVTAAATWQWVTVVIPGDKAGTWVGGVNAAASVLICFAVGTTHETTVNTWVTGNYMGTSSNTNFFATNGNVVIITGVIILPGLAMPPVSRTGLILRPSSEEIRLCQRYLWTSVGNPFGVSAIGNSFAATGYIGGAWLFPVKMRVTPTMSLPGIGSWPVVNTTQPVIWLVSPDGFSMYATALSASNCYWYAGSGDGVMADARM